MLLQEQDRVEQVGSRPDKIRLTVQVAPADLAGRCLPAVQDQLRLALRVRAMAVSVAAAVLFAVMAAAADTQAAAPAKAVPAVPVVVAVVRSTAAQIKPIQPASEQETDKLLCLTSRAVLLLLLR